jgi:heme/copper-type cytochrome/quinol oxidase subunit 2
MVVRNTLCKRIVVGYCVFFLTVLLIWRHHEKSIKLEEDEDTLKPIIGIFPTTIITHTTPVTHTTSISEQTSTKINSNRLDYWLKNNSKTLGINLTAILAPKRRGKYLVYVCHENCGGYYFNNIF